MEELKNLHPFRALILRQAEGGLHSSPVTASTTSPTGSGSHEPRGQPSSKTLRDA